MLIKFFRLSYLPQFILLFFLELVFWGGSIWHPVESSFETDVYPLYNILLNLTGDIIWLEILLAFVLLYIEALLVNIIATENNLAPKNTLIPAMLFIILMSHSPDLTCLNPVLCANLFILLSVLIILKCYEETNIINHVFNASLFLSIASLFYFPAVFIIIWVWATFIIFRIDNWRAWIISMISIAIPYIYLFAYRYIIDMTSIFDDYGSYLSNVSVINTDYHRLTYISCGMIIIITLVSIFHILMKLKEKNINIRRKILVMIWFIFISSLLLLYGGEHFLINESINFMPFTIFLAFYIGFGRDRKWLEIYLLVLVVLIIFNNYFFNIHA